MTAETHKTDGLVRPYSFLLIQLHRVSDMVWMCASLLVCHWFFDGAITGRALMIGVGAALIFGVVAAFRHLYRSWRIAPLDQELDRLWRTWFVTSAVVLAVVYFLGPEFPISRSAIIAWLLTSLGFLAATRVIFRVVLRSWRRAGHNYRRAAIVGANGIGQKTAETLLRNRWMGIHPVGFFDDRKGDDSRELAHGPIPILGTIDEMVERAKSGALDIVYIALPMRSELRITQINERLSESTVSVYVIPDFRVFDLLHAQWETLGNIPLLGVVKSPFGELNAVTKRAQDIVLSILFLAIAAIPMLMTAAAIKLTSPGPVIYRQRRHGLNGQEFVIWKFRTMTISETDDQFQQATRNDPRVTPIGQFLRRTSIDELPQLINVLQGRMSIVGPRPHPLKLNEQHQDYIRRFRLRHMVKPGITGWAQVNGLRGETDTPAKMRRRIEYDLEYIDTWSVWLDLRIIIQTVFKGMFSQHAY